MKFQFSNQSLAATVALSAGGLATANINGCFDYRYEVRDRAAPSSPDAAQILHPDMSDASAVDMLKINAFFVDKRAMDLVLSHIGDDETISRNEAERMVEVYVNDDDATPDERRYRRHSLKRAAEAIMGDVSIEEDPNFQSRSYGTSQSEAHMESAYNLMIALGVKGPWQGKIDELLNLELAIDSMHEMNLEEVSDLPMLVKTLTSYAPDNATISLPAARKIIETYAGESFAKRRDLAIATLILSQIKPYCNNSNVIQTTAKNLGIALDETYEPFKSIENANHSANAHVYFECLLDAGLRHGYVDVDGERDSYIDYIERLGVENEVEERTVLNESRTVVQSLKDDPEKGLATLGKRLEWFVDMATGEF